MRETRMNHAPAIRRRPGTGRPTVAADGRVGRSRPNRRPARIAKITSEQNRKTVSNLMDQRITFDGFVCGGDERSHSPQLRGAGERTVRLSTSVSQGQRPVARAGRAAPVRTNEPAEDEGHQEPKIEDDRGLSPRVQASGLVPETRARGQDEFEPPSRISAPSTIIHGRRVPDRCQAGSTCRHLSHDRRDMIAMDAVIRSSRIRLLSGSASWRCNGRRYPPTRLARITASAPLSRARPWSIDDGSTSLTCRRTGSCSPHASSRDRG